MADTYLPAFRKAVKDGKAAGMMCSYNAINGVPTCASTALSTLLRDVWGFDGYVTSDSGAISDIYHAHQYTKTAENATALALKAGCDINSGTVYAHAAATGVLNPRSPLYNVSLVDAVSAVPLHHSSSDNDVMGIGDLIYFYYMFKCLSLFL